MVYYGQSSCESDLDRYLESLKFLWRRRPQSRESPIIINTMGWVKGQIRLRSVTAESNTGTQCLNQCLSPGVHRIWISAPGGHDPLLPSVARHPAGPQWYHPMSRPHPRVSADSPRVSDAPTCSDSSGWVYREPQPPQKLHSSYHTVNIPGSGTTGKRVSIPLSACVVFNSQHWSFLHQLWVHCVWQETPAQ